MNERFPEVDWYCDECNEPLNDQSGFNDQNDVWSCTECGHPNSISGDSILTDADLERAWNRLKNFDPRKFRK